MMRKVLPGLVCAVLCLSLALPARAGGADGYWYVSVRDIKFTGGTLPAPLQPDAVRGYIPWEQWSSMRPWVAVEGGGEAYADNVGDYWNWPDEFVQNGAVAVKAPANKPVKGTLYLYLPGDPAEGRALGFTLPAAAASKGARESFLLAKERYYGQLKDRRLPGAAWFRHQHYETVGERTGTAPPAGQAQPQPQAWTGGDEVSESFEMFTGGRALAENLQIDRLLANVRPEEPTVDPATIPGVDVKAFDWKPYVAHLQPALDPLAEVVPADQHALFFPSFKDMLDLMDEADRLGTEVLHAVGSGAEDALTRDRYERQLCLETSALARLLGPTVIASVAFTGSDPYLMSGSDVAVLFEALAPDVVRKYVLARYESAVAGPDKARTVQGKVGNAQYWGVVSANRSVSSYTATLGHVVVVTNSLYQLGRIVDTWSGTSPPLATADEYLFFRDRYPITDEQETALLVVPDQALRRWLSPRWRIVDSRRVRAASVLAELQARHLSDVAAGKTGPLPAEKETGVQALGDLSLTASGVMSSTYCSLSFQTPVAELPFDKVTQSEANAYAWFRDGYQRNWQYYFDPIAIRFTARPEKVAFDVTVMPLIAQTEYREIMELTVGAELAPDGGDRHEGSLAHAAMAINVSSEAVRQATSFMRSMVPGLSLNPVEWMGSTVAVYADDDPVWAEVARAKDPEDFMEENYWRLPLALNVEIKNSMKATMFLAALRGTVEQVAPGMTIWETLTWQDKPYVKVSPARTADTRDIPDKLALYYSLTPASLTLTLSEPVIRRALERQAAREKGELKDSGTGWLGKHLGLAVSRTLVEAVEIFARPDYDRMMQAESWRNLPILNEWKRLYPDQDPVAFHERVWGTRLVCPGGGSYAWNAQWHTMESTVYGHPYKARSGPSFLARTPFADVLSASFGLTFENDGLRSRAEMIRRRK